MKLVENKKKSKAIIKFKKKIVIKIYTWKKKWKKFTKLRWRNIKKTNEQSRFEYRNGFEILDYIWTSLQFTTPGIRVRVRNSLIMGIIFTCFHCVFSSVWCCKIVWYHLLFVVEFWFRLSYSNRSLHIKSRLGSVSTTIYYQQKSIICFNRDDNE